MRYVITANWKAKDDVHHNPTILECDDRQDAFRIGYMISMSPGCEIVEVRDKEAEDGLIGLAVPPL
jgi:hypothetical protein